ncbi:MAG TPA: MFS transporter [Treponemataceae bacterium]|mgnify:CR=1 FL=1|nr:MFS transporter [Treponemataceae bacterium]
MSKQLTQAQLVRAMRISIFSGASSVVWQLVCSIQPIFNVFFENYLGASAGQLGLLVSIIQAAAAFQILGIFLYGWIGRLKPIFMVGHIAHRSLTAIIAFVAFYVARGGSNGRGIVIIIVAMGISWCFANATSACWWGWVADLFPESTRGSFFMRRSSIIQIVNIVWFFLASTMLDVFPKKNALIVFGVIISVGAVAGLLDILSQMVTPEVLPDQRHEFNSALAFEPLKNRDFVRYAVAIGLATFSMNLVSPFQSPYVVSPERIGAPNTWLGIMQLISQALWVLVAPFWGTVMDRWGRKPVVILGTLLVVGWIGYLFLTPGNYFIVLPLISATCGILSPAFWEGSNQMMLSLAPVKNRVSYVAWYLAIVGLVSAPGSLAGGLLSDALKGFSLQAGPFAFSNFHVVQLLSIVLCSLCAFLISRVREGSERPFGFVVSQITNPQIIRTYQNLDSLGRSPSALSNAEILRKFGSGSGELPIHDIIERLDDPDSAVQEEAARALGRIHSCQAVDALILRLLDHDSDIRVLSARSLGKIGDRKAVGALVGCLWESDGELQKACLEALADIGDEESIKQVMTFLRESQTDHMRQISSAAAARLGIFEAAWDIFPNIFRAASARSRKQYAIAMANLLGKPGEFYQYVSGSATVTQGRQKKLVARFSQNMQEVYARQRKKGKLKADVIEKVRLALEEDRNVDALRETVAFSERLFADIFGEGVQSEMLWRVDQPLGVYSWMMAQAKEYLAGPKAESADAGEIARLVTLLSVYFLSQY